METPDNLEESQAGQVSEKDWSHPSESNLRPTDYESRNG